MSIRVLFVLVFVLVFSANSYAQEIAESRSLKTPILWAVAGQGVDVAMSGLAFSAGGMREGNPILPASIGRIAAIKGVVTLGNIALARMLDRRGHPKVARVLLYVTAGAGGFGATWTTVTIVRIKM